MPVLADIERLFERIFERSTARLFRTGVQVVQLERRVERTMDQARVTVAGRTSVPSRYRVRMQPSDLAAVAERGGGAEALAARLADAGFAFARVHGYHLSGRPTVSLIADPSLPGGQVEVDAVVDRPFDAAPQPRRARVAASGPTAPAVDIEGVDAQLGQPAASVRGDGTQTRIYRRPVPETARAVLRVIADDAPERTIEVDGSPLSIGRAADNGLVLRDARVSRHHGRLQARRGALVYTDLGSTNGSRVNGVRVDELVLGQGDRLEIGDTVLVVEILPG